MHTQQFTPVVCGCSVKQLLSLGIRGNIACHSAWRGLVPGQEDNNKYGLKIIQPDQWILSNAL